jgi:hypothetical protein
MLQIANTSQSGVPEDKFSPSVRSARAITAAFLVCLIVALVPLWFVDYPPLQDYPFHIARMYILEHWHASQHLQNWYEIRSFVLPNVGMDLLVLALSKALPTGLAGQTFVALTFALTLGGTLFLYRIIHQEFAFWPLIASLFLFNKVLFMGFLNYLFGVAVLLWAIGLWIYASSFSPWVRVLVGTLLSTALFFCHIVALVLFAVVVAGLELQRAMGTFSVSKATASRNLIVGASIFVVPFVLFLMSPTSGEAEGESVRNLFMLDFWYKSVLVKNTWITQEYPLLDASLIVFALLATFFVVFKGKLKIHTSMYLALALLLLVYLLSPPGALSGAFLAMRIPVAILYVLIASTQILFVSRAWHNAFLSLVFIALLVNSSVVSFVWAKSSKILSQFTAAFSLLPDNSVLFVANATPKLGHDLWIDRAVPIRHVASLAVLNGKTVVPATWSHPSQQPIVIKDHYQPIKDFQGNNPIDITSQEGLVETVGDLQRLTADAGIPASSVYLLILQPRHSISNPSTTVSQGKYFTLLSLDKKVFEH